MWHSSWKNIAAFNYLTELVIILRRKKMTTPMSFTAECNSVSATEFSFGFHSPNRMKHSVRDNKIPIGGFPLAANRSRLQNLVWNVFDHNNRSIISRQQMLPCTKHFSYVMVHNSQPALIAFYSPLVNHRSDHRHFRETCRIHAMTPSVYCM